VLIKLGVESKGLEIGKVKNEEKKGNKEEKINKRIKEWKSTEAHILIQL